MDKERKYYYKLDIVRVIACILILFYHLNILRGGFLAVTTFFVLTGYLSCLKFLENNSFSFKKYYLNRFKKIYIPLIVVIFLSLFVYRFFIDVNWLNIKSETLSALFGYNNFWQISASLNYFTKHISSPFIHLWFISILIQFDLIFPIVFSIFKKIDEKITKHFSTIMVSILTIVSTLYFVNLSHNSNIMMAYYNSFARCFSIFLGVLLAIINYKYNFKLSRLFKGLSNYIFDLYIILLVVPCFFVSAKTNNFVIYMIIVTIISARLIEYATLNDQKNNIFSKTIKYLSSISYEIYLTQYPIIFYMQSVSINAVLKTLIIILLTASISGIIHFLINLKINKYAKIFFGISCLAFIGYVLISEKDYSGEMKELENKLNDNLKVIEQKNSEYLNNLNLEQDEWNKTLESLEVNENEIANIVRNLPVVGIGDSVLLGAIDGLYEKFPNGYFDGKVSRTIVKAEEILIDLKNQGKLPDTLILALANNGDYSDYINRGLMEIVGDRQVYWVTAVLADDPAFNDRFREFAKNYPNIHIVEWEKLSKNHPEYFYADGIHVKEEGVPAYAQVIYDAIYGNYLAEYQAKKNEAIINHENELKEKIAFYGNNILIKLFDTLYPKFNTAIFNTKDNYSFEELKIDLQKKIDANSLEYKIVLLFDDNADIGYDEYIDIINICSNHQIYIVNLSDDKLNIFADNVKVIDLYEEIKNTDSDFNSKDLSNNVNKLLVDILAKNIY